MNPYASYEKTSPSGQSRNFISFLKILVLTLIGLAVNVFSVIYFLKFFKDMSAVSLLIGFLLAAAGFVLTTLDAFFVKKFGVVFLITVIKTATPLVIFFSTLAPQGVMQKEGLALYVILTGAALFLTLTLSGVVSSKNIIDNSVRIKFFLAAKPTLAKTMTGFALFMAAIFFVSYFEWGYWNEALGKNMSDKIMRSLNPVAGVIIPGASFTMKADDFVKALAEQELIKLSVQSFKEGGSESFSLDLLSPNERQKIISKASSEIKTRLESVPVIGALNGSEPVSDIIFRLIKKYIVDFQAKSGKIIFSASITLFFFFLIKFIFALFYWFVDLVTYIFFKILIVTGFGYIAFESSKKEVIMI